ncbi:MAG: YncE family protein [Chthoniobacteraceae bacterium]
MKTPPALILGLLTASLLTPLGHAADAPPYHLLKEIHIGGDGGWDYLSADPAARRLYVSHGTKVVVIDTEKDAVAGEIADTPGVHGIAIGGDLGKLFVSDGKENKVSIVDAKDLKTTAKIDVGQNPDSILFEPGTKEVYAFNGRGSSASVLNAETGQVVATIPLNGKPETGQADPDAGRVYDTLEDKSEVVAIDARTHVITNRWPIAPGEAGSGMAIDPAHHRLFIGCDNHLLVMLDTASGKVTGSVPIGQGVDAVSFDPGTQLVFASCGDGHTTIAHEDAPDKLTVVQTLDTARGARTMTIDPTTHRIYLSTAEFQTPAQPLAPHQRPPLVAGSFKVLVFGNEPPAKSPKS